MIPTRWLILLSGVGVAAGAALVAAHSARRDTHPAVVLVPPGTFRASIVCDEGFERGCDRMYPYPGSKPRWRVILWLDAFLADADLVTYVEYQACRDAGACKGAAPPPRRGACSRDAVGVAFEDARAYCAWRGWRLPTADEVERMGRWVDGRPHAGGDEERHCDHRASPEGIRDLNTVGQWVSSPGGAPGKAGWGNSAHFLPFGHGLLAFRCVRSLRPGPNPGVGMPWPTQDDPWVEGGPDD